MWLLLSIMLVAWDLLEDSQFPPVDKGLLEVAQFSSLWATKDIVRVMETKVLWELMEVAINQKLQLSPMVFEKLS